ncbi:hypothetical protein [Spirosoma koreense]
MKTQLAFLLVVVVGLVISCQRVTSIDPPTATIVGSWVIDRFEITNLPKWYVAKHNIPFFVASTTDTFYLAGLLSATQNVTSFTFTSDGTFSEQYLANADSIQIAKTQIDRGTWILKDPIVNLQVANYYPNQLIYSLAKDELFTGKIRQTAVLQQTTLPPFAKDTVTYTIRMFYKKSL